MTAASAPPSPAAGPLRRAARRVDGAGAATGPTLPAAAMLTPRVLAEWFAFLARSLATTASVIAIAVLSGAEWAASVASNHRDFCNGSTCHDI